MDGRALDAPGAGNVSHIGNKAKRQELFAKYKKEKRQRKLARRLELAKAERKSADGRKKLKERLRTNKTRTIENTRDYNPTVLNAANTHEVPDWMKPQKQQVRDEQDQESEHEEGSCLLYTSPSPRD